VLVEHVNYEKNRINIKILLAYIRNSPGSLAPISSGYYL